MNGIMDALVQRGCKVTLISNCRVPSLIPEGVEMIPVNLEISKFKRRLLMGIAAITPGSLIKVVFWYWINYFYKLLIRNNMNEKPVVFFEYFDTFIGYILKKGRFEGGCIMDMHGLADLEYLHMKNLSAMAIVLNQFKLYATSWLDRKKFESVDYLIVLNNLFKEYMCVKYDFLSHDKFIILNDGVSVALTKQSINWSLKSDIINKYRLSRSCKLVGFIGSFKNMGGVPDLVRSFKLIHDKYDNIFLLLVGDGEDMPTVMQLISEYGLQKKVIVHGRSRYEDLSTFYDLCDIVVCPDLMHPFNNMIVHTKYYEAIYGAKIVLNGAFDSVMEFNGADKYSVNFRPSDVCDLALKLNFALDNLNSLTAKYLGNKEEIFRNFSYYSHVKSLIDLYSTYYDE